MKKIYGELDKKIAVELYKKIPTEFTEFYFNHQKDFEGFELDDEGKHSGFYDFILANIDDNFKDGVDIVSLRNNLTRNSNRLRKKWVAATTESELDNDIMKSILEWDEQSKPLFQYPLFQELSIRKQCSFYVKDLILLLAKILSTEYDSNIAWVVPALTTELICNPIFGPTETMIDLLIDDEYKDEPIIVDEYYAPDDFLLRTLVKSEDSQVLTNIQTLDQTDRTIISLIYSMIRPGFYSDRVIDVNILGITKQIYSSINQNRVTDIENRIKKIGKYQCEIVPNNKNGKRSRSYAMINFFESVFISQDIQSGKIKARLTMGETLYKSFLRRATYQVFPGASDILDNRLAKLLLTSLQADRLRLVLKNDSRVDLPLDYFKSKVRFRYKREDTTITKISQALEYLKLKEVVVKDHKYSKNTKTFTVDFLPLSDEERYIFKFNTSTLDDYEELSLINYDELLPMSDS